MQLDRRLQDLKGPWIDRYGAGCGVLIGPRHVACGVVEAHAPMDAGDCIECILDGCRHDIVGRICDRDLNERPEQWLCPAQPIARGCHRPPQSASHLRSRDVTTALHPKCCGCPDPPSMRSHCSCRQTARASWRREPRPRTILDIAGYPHARSEEHTS